MKGVLTVFITVVVMAAIPCSSALAEDNNNKERTDTQLAFKLDGPNNSEKETTITPKHSNNLNTTPYTLIIVQPPETNDRIGFKPPGIKDDITFELPEKEKEIKPLPPKKK